MDSCALRSYVFVYLWTCVSFGIDRRRCWWYLQPVNSGVPDRKAARSDSLRNLWTYVLVLLYTYAQLLF